MQSIWIQRLALLQISNMTLGTPINLLHLSSLAVKWKESYYYFLLAHLPVFSTEPVSVFGEFPGVTRSIHLAEATQVKCCAKSQAWRHQRQSLEDHLPPVPPVAESFLPAWDQVPRLSLTQQMTPSPPQVSQGWFP